MKSEQNKNKKKKKKNSVSEYVKKKFLLFEK